MKYVFVTGGVVSGLGKGICAASLGRLLKQRGLRVRNQKFDPYLNVDPGTMSPYQHGEVFVTDDGAETDLDLGHYERFVDESLTGRCSVSSGRVYWDLLNRERQGAFLGGTVQIIPHVTDEIKSHVYAMEQEDVDVLICEIGGTVGDIESQPFLEAIRQVAVEKGRENVVYIHVPLIVQIPGSGELKSKPTQHSVKELLSLGIQPDILVCRSDVPIPEDMRKKIALFCNISEDCVIQNTTADTLYEVPLLLQKEGLDEIVCRKLGLFPPGGGHDPLGRHGQRYQKRQPGGHHCAGGQVRAASRRLSQRGGVPVPRRHGLRRGGAYPLGGLGDRDGGKRGAGAVRVQRHSGARRLRRPGHRGHDRRRPVRPRATTFPIWASAWACRSPSLSLPATCWAGPTPTPQRWRPRPPIPSST